MEIKIVSLNIGAASKDRARRILDKWLIPSCYDVCVLTETSNGEGTDAILGEFRSAGWQVLRRQCLPNDRGVAVVSRINAIESTQYPASDPAPGRAVIAELSTIPKIHLIGMYVPNRGNDVTKAARKSTYLACWLRHLIEAGSKTLNVVLLGDLNVVPPSQRPVFLPQTQAEYEWYQRLIDTAGLYDAAVQHGVGHENTWTAHNGEGYTYDHILPSNRLCRHVVDFRYDHSTRQKPSVTDHSAVSLSVAVDAAEYITHQRLGQPQQRELF